MTADSQTILVLACFVASRNICRMEEKQNVFWKDSIKQFLYETKSLSFFAGWNDFKIAQKLYTIHE